MIGLVLLDLLLLPFKKLLLRLNRVLVPFISNVLDFLCVALETIPNIAFNQHAVILILLNLLIKTLLIIFLLVVRFDCQELLVAFNLLLFKVFVITAEVLGLLQQNHFYLLDLL